MFYKIHNVYDIQVNIKQFFILILVLSFSCCTNDVKEDRIQTETIVENTSFRKRVGVQWLNWSAWPIKEAMKDKKAIVYIYEDNCTHCNTMDTYVFGNPIIADYINKHFYAAKLNGQEKQEIRARGKIWKYKELEDGRSYHSFAAALATHDMERKSHIPYPTIVFLDENFDMIIPIKKVMDARELQGVLAYVNENKYREMDLDEFEKSFIYTID